MERELLHIYNRLQKQGWEGWTHTMFKNLTPVAFSLDFIDGQDPATGETRPEALPWFELKAQAEAYNTITGETETYCYEGFGTTYFAGLGNLLDDIDKKSRRNCVWTAPEFTLEEAEQYLNNHMVFGRWMAKTCTFETQTYEHPADGHCEIHTVQAGPFRFDVLGTDPFLCLRETSRDGMITKLAQRVELAYGDQDFVYASEILKRAHLILLKADAYDYFQFHYSPEWGILVETCLQPEHRDNPVAAAEEEKLEGSVVHADTVEELIVGLALLVQQEQWKEMGEEQ